MNFFLDDFLFLKISRAESLGDFIRFFSPLREYSYKPLATEVFYYLIHLFKENTFISHIIVFATYFAGLYYFYRSLFFITKNELLSKLTVFLYSISFIHVFQLYYLGTYQEIAVFTFLSVSFYLFFIKKYFWSVAFYSFALLSKETAILYFPFLLVINLIVYKKRVRKYFLHLLLFLVVSVIFCLLYQYSLGYVTSLDQYKPRYSPKVILNNGMWYFLWSLGVPNFVPVYFISIFQKPIADFWRVWENSNVRIYFYIFGGYLALFITSLVIYVFKNKKEVNKIISLGVFCLLSFFIFLGPILLFMHRWMVRLMLPLIFVSLFQAYIITKYFNNKSLFKKFAFILLILYFFVNIYGIKVHESSSTYLLESRFVNNAEKYFASNRNKIITHKYIYFKDPPKTKPNPWGSSEKLKVTFHDQSFLDHFFSNKNMKAIYNFENNNIPEDSYIAESIDILHYGEYELLQKLKD